MNTVNTSVYTNDNSQGRFVLTNYIDIYKLRTRNNVPTTDTVTSSATMAQSGTGMTNVPNDYTNVSSTTETKDKTTTTTTTTTTSSANTNSGIRSNSIQNDSYTKTVGSVPPVNTNNQTVTTQKSTVTTSTTGNAAPSGINNNTGTTKVETTTTTQQVKPNSPVKTTTEYKSTYKTEEKKSSGIFPWILSAGLAVLSGILLYKNRKLSGNIDEAVEKKYGELKKGYEETIAKLNEKIEGLEKTSSTSTSTTTPVVPPTGGAAAGGLLRTGDYEIATAPTTWVDKSGLIKNYFLGKNIEFTPDRLFSMLFQNLGIRNVAEFKNANITRVVFHHLMGNDFFWHGTRKKFLFRAMFFDLLRM